MNKRVLFALLLCSLVLLSSCAPEDAMSSNYVNLKAVDEKTYVAFSQINLELTAKQQTANLYFRYGSQNVLVAEPRQIEVRSGETAELAILKELLRGPKTSSGFLFSLMPSGAEVINVVSLQDNRILAITFSEAFVQKGAKVADEAAERIRRELLLHSICLSITDNSPYLGIQIFIKPDDAGASTYRLDNTFMLQSSNLPMIPTVRSDTYVSNPQNIAKLLLGAWSRKDLDTMQHFLSAAPNLNELSALVESRNNIITYDLDSGSLYDNGTKATLAATLEPINSDEYMVFPLRLVNEDGIWKVDYDNFVTLLDFI